MNKELYEELYALYSKKVELNIDIFRFYRDNEMFIYENQVDYTYVKQKEAQLKAVEERIKELVYVQ